MNVQSRRLGKGWVEAWGFNFIFRRMRNISKIHSPQPLLNWKLVGDRHGRWHKNAVVMVDFIFHTSFCIKFDPGFKRKMNGNLKLQKENSIKAVEYMVPSVRSVALFFDEKLHILRNINF